MGISLKTCTCLTVNGRQYKIVAVPNGTCHHCDLASIGCGVIYFCNIALTSNFRVAKRVRESHKGRRCIRSDFKIGAKIWCVGDATLRIDLTKLNTAAVSDWLRDAYYMLVPFTTERAAKAYVAMRQKQRGVS